MHQYASLSLYGVTALILYYLVSKITTRIRHASKARQLGCQPAPTIPDVGFMGIKQIQRLQKHDKNRTLINYLEERANMISEHTGRVCSTYCANLFGNTVYFTTDPKNIQAMLATQFQDYDLGDVRYQIMGGTLGDGIFTLDGKKWEHSRAMLRPNFVRDQISDLDMEERHFQEMLQVMPTHKDGWTDLVDIQALFFRLTIDAATEFLFGDSCSSQLAEAQASFDAKDSFSRRFDSAQKHMAFKFRLDRMHWMYNPKEYQEDNRIIDKFVDRYVERALKLDSKKKSESASGKEKYVFLEALIEKTRDPIELRSQLLNILLAGRDTTASLLSWTFDQLLRHPEVFTKLRSTVLENFGTYDDPQGITFATLKSCQYLQHTINEVLRLWTVVPGNARRTNKDTTLPRGGGPDGQSPVFIPKNSLVEYNIHIMHRSKDIWGEDADQFKPERWQGRKPGWEYLPFNGGPRICIGQQFALTEAGYVIVRLLQRFDKIEAAPGLLEGEILTNLTLTSSPGRNVVLKLHEAKA